MIRPRGRLVAVAGILATTGCLFLWTAPVKWNSLDSLQPFRGAFDSCPAKQPANGVQLVRVAEDGTQYRLIRASSPRTPDWSVVRRGHSLPADCLDDYVGNGATCGDPNSPDEQFDFVWTWSNGSEALHRKAYRDYEASTLPDGSQSLADHPARLKLFRDHDELRHSLRSVLQHFRPHLNKIHLITGDLPVPETVEDQAALNDGCSGSQHSTLRLGQLPSWLDASRTDGDVRIDVTHHSQYFGQYNGTVFNSLAIESQFPNLPDLHDQFIYMNDDFFFVADLRPADFYTKAYGTVFRLWPNYLIKSKPDHGFNTQLPTAEMVAFEWSNELLGRRFGFRARPYPAHESKVVSTPIFRELAAMFADKLADSARSKVRSQRSSKVTNVHTMMLYLNFVVERHREAVLWSWAVARMTQIAERGEEDWVEAAWQEVGGLPKTNQINVKARPRATLGKDRAKSLLGEEAGHHAWGSYAFASDDGYPYASLGEKGFQKWPEMRNINVEATGHEHYQCKINRDRCFPTRDDLALGYTPADFFRHIAFVDYECGDCIITQLIAESGFQGLSAILPDASADAVIGSTFEEAPHLPLVEDYLDGDFSVPAVVPHGTELRAFSVQLIHRYRYVIGRVFSGFAMLQDPKQAKEEILRLEGYVRSRKVGVLCINDDIIEDPETVDKDFREWQDGMWTTPAVWETDRVQ